MTTAQKPKLVVVGGSGKVAVRFSRLAAPFFEITSLVRSESSFETLTSIGCTPKIQDIESDSTTPEILSNIFRGASHVLFSAGAGGKGGPERTKKVDYEGALKVFDAIEFIPEPSERPKLTLVSAIDLRDRSKPPPAYYTEADIQISNRIWSAIGTYMHYKRLADLNLKERTGFKWTIIRPGGLLDQPGSGTVDMGRTHCVEQISRDDVAATILKLMQSYVDSFNGVAVDLVGGDTPIKLAIERALEKGEYSVFD